MIDLLLLAGVALCALSVVMAIVSVARTQAPRGAAIALVLGIGALFATVLLDTRPLGVAALQQSWQNVVSGKAFGVNDAPPAAAPDATDAEPAAPGVEAPAASQ